MLTVNKIEFVLHFLVEKLSKIERETHREKQRDSEEEEKWRIESGTEKQR